MRYSSGVSLIWRSRFQYDRNVVHSGKGDPARDQKQDERAGPLDSQLAAGLGRRDRRRGAGSSQAVIEPLIFIGPYGVCISRKCDEDLSEIMEVIRLWHEPYEIDVL